MVIAVVGECHHTLHLWGDIMKLNLPKKKFFFKFIFFYGDSLASPWVTVSLFPDLSV